MISLRDYQDDKADVIDKYNADEVRQLKARGAIPESVKIVENAMENEDEDEDDIPYEFDDVGKRILWSTHLL